LLSLSRNILQHSFQVNQCDENNNNWTMISERINISTLLCFYCVFIENLSGYKDFCIISAPKHIRRKFLISS